MMKLCNWVRPIWIAGIVLATTSAAFGQITSVRLNEIRIDQANQDDDEYIELTGPPGQSLDGLWFINIGDTNNGNAEPGEFSGGIEMAIDLTGEEIAPDGFFLIAKSSFGTGSLGISGTVDLVVPDSAFLGFGDSDNFTWMIVTNFVGTIGLDVDSNATPALDNDGTLDLMPWDMIIDQVATVESHPPVNPGDEWVYAPTILGPSAGLFAPAHIYRSVDGGGTWQIGSFNNGGQDTPGASNTLLPAAAAQGVSFILQDVESVIHLQGGNPIFGDPTICMIGSLTPLQIRIDSLPEKGQLLDNGGVIAAPGATVSGDLRYAPSSGFSGVVEFEFTAIDANLNASTTVVQEIGVQLADSVVITEIMYSPVGVDDQFQFIEVYNPTGATVSLATIDNEAFEVSQGGGKEIDTTNNLLGCSVPPGELRYIVPDASSIGFDTEEFLCEWRLAAADICFVPIDVWESIDVSNQSNCITSESDRIMLFNTNGDLVDGVPLDIPGDLNCRDTSRTIDSDFVFPEEVNSEDNDQALTWNCAEDLFDQSNVVTGESALREVDDEVFRSTSNVGFVLAGIPAVPFTFEPSCTGACCLPDGTCEQLSDPDCRERTCNLTFGSFTPDTMCNAVSCNVFPVGGCCLPTGDCIDTDGCTCDRAGGTFDEVNTCGMIVSCPTLVTLGINEIDYSQPGTDVSEFVEISGTPGTSLGLWQLVFFNGAVSGSNVYRTVDLSEAGVMPTNGFLVVGSSLVDEVDIVAWKQDGIQNDGGFPDGVALLLAGVVQDEIAYGGSGFNGIGSDAGTIGLTAIGVEDTQLGSLQRLPDLGAWTPTLNRTPGESNTNGSDVIGSCCLPNAVCVNTDAASCASVGGDFGGAGTRCPDNDEFLACYRGPVTAYIEPLCDGFDSDKDGEIDLFDFQQYQIDYTACDGDPTGACCQVNGACVVTNQFDCEAGGGAYQGDDVACESSDCPPPAVGAVVINEVWADDPSADSGEFFELHGAPNADLTGLTLIVVDGDTGGNPASVNFRLVTRSADLTGFALDGNGFFSAGSGAFAGLTDVNLDAVFGDNDGNVDELQNDSQTYALVLTADIDFCVGAGNPDVSCNGGGSQLTQASYDAISAGAIDAVATSDNPADHVYFGAPVVSDGGAAADYLQRIPNGQDTGSPSDFEVGSGFEPGDPADPSTPSATNTSDVQTGACCDGQDCAELTEVQCIDSNGIFQGYGTTCGSPSVCECLTVAQARLLPETDTGFICDAVITNTVDQVNSSCCYSFHIEDDTGAITVFGTQQDIQVLLEELQAGDQIDIFGEIDIFNGLVEFINVSLENHDGFVGVREPQVVTLADFADASPTAESLESELVRIEQVEIIGIQGGGGVCNPLPATFVTQANYCVSPVGSSQHMIVRVGTDFQGFQGEAIPTGVVNITGIFSQFDSTNPFNGGYQILLRNTDDIEVFVP